MASDAASIQANLAYLNANGARVDYNPEFLSSGEADRYLLALLGEVEFDSAEASSIRPPFSKSKVPIPRRQSAYGDPGTRYAFSGIQVPGRPWIAPLLELRQLLTDRTGFRPNFVLLNHYRSGADCIGWHADDESDLGPEPVLLSLSLGVTRDFQLRHKQAFPRGAGRPSARDDLRTVSLPLRAGSLLTLRHPTNANWKHQLPRRGGKRAGELGERLNLTWRSVTR